MSVIVIMQRGPTCGIYALLTGIKDFYSLEKLTNSKIHEMVFTLLKLNHLGDDKPASAGNTFVGEFFVINDYLTFINKNKRFIEDEILNKLNKNIVLEVSKIPFTQILKEENALFIVPILKSKVKKNGQATSHWISFQSNGAKYKVINSCWILNKSLTFEEIRVKHENLIGSSFYWEKYKKRYCCPTNKMERDVKYRLKMKYNLLENKVLPNKIDYQAGEVIIIKKG